MQLQIGYDRKTQGDKKSMGLDTQTMLKAENGCVDLVDNPSSGRDKLREIARLQPGWSSQNLWRDVWPWGGHDFLQGG